MNRPHLWLVDDDPSLGVIVEVLTRKSGQSLARFLDVESAWQAYHCPNERRPQLVLLDFNLPGHPGLELLRRWHYDQRASEAPPPVALFCQSLRSGDIAAGWQAGARYLLPKDVVLRAETWQKRIHEILLHADGRAQLPSLPWQQEDALSNLSWVDVVNRALTQPDIRVLGAEVIDQVLQRGLRESIGVLQEEWLVPHAGLLSPQALSPLRHVESVGRMIDSLVDQIWCLLGPEGSQSFVEGLREIKQGPQT